MCVGSSSMFTIGARKLDAPVVLAGCQQASSIWRPSDACQHRPDISLGAHRPSLFHMKDSIMLLGKNLESGWLLCHLSRNLNWGRVVDLVRLLQGMRKLHATMVTAI